VDLDPEGLKGKVLTRFIASRVFHESVSPQPQSIPLGPFRIFSKIRGDTVFTSHGAPPVSTTPVANLRPVSTTPAANFATSFASAVDIGGNEGKNVSIN
jgi:hypothetical protein